jgi:hypothetical protein
MAFIKIGPNARIVGGTIARNTVAGKNPRLLDVEGSLKDVAIEDNVGIPSELWAGLQADKQAGMDRASMMAKWTERLVAVGANVTTIMGLLFRT